MARETYAPRTPETAAVVEQIEDRRGTRRLIIVAILPGDQVSELREEYAATDDDSVYIEDVNSCNSRISDLASNGPSTRTWLCVLPSIALRKIHLCVPAEFARLKIVECKTEEPATRQRRIILDSSSTYSDIPLNRWHEERHKVSGEAFTEGDVVFEYSGSQMISKTASRLCDVPTMVRDILSRSAHESPDNDHETARPEFPWAPSRNLITGSGLESEVRPVMSHFDFTEEGIYIFVRRCSMDSEGGGPSSAEAASTAYVISWTQLASWLRWGYDCFIEFMAILVNAFASLKDGLIDIVTGIWQMIKDGAAWVWNLAVGQRSPKEMNERNGAHIPLRVY